MSAHQETLRLLARMYEASERGDSEVSMHLRAHGWEYIDGKFRSPDEIESLPKCRWCGEKFDPDATYPYGDCSSSQPDIEHHEAMPT